MHGTRLTHIMAQRVIGAVAHGGDGANPGFQRVLSSVQIVAPLRRRAVQAQVRGANVRA